MLPSGQRFARCEWDEMQRLMSLSFEQVEAGADFRETPAGRECIERFGHKMRGNAVVN